MIAVISHDAGGAEVLSSYVRMFDLDCCYVLAGPAYKIFESKLGIVKNIPLEEAISQAKSIICSTSWQSDIEFNAIKSARRLGKRSVSFLDHWVNYRDRFVREGETVLPDEIWVGDCMAEAMAKETFPGATVILKENPYLKDIQKELLAFQIHRPLDPETITVLYVCEPISTHALLRHGDARHWGYVEEDALYYFLSNISLLGKPIERIVIRPHPSEELDKYNWVLEKFNLPIQFGETRPLIEEIIKSDVVVGCESMAMVVALLADKKVLSCIPPNGRACRLPHVEIASLQNIIENKRTIYGDVK